MAGNSIAITGGRVVPIEGDPIEGGTVLLTDGKIAAVADAGFKPAPGTDLVDATGKWVLPGFIDAHVHLGVNEEGEGWAGRDTNLGLERRGRLMTCGFRHGIRLMELDLAP